MEVGSKVDVWNKHNGNFMGKGTKEAMREEDWDRFYNVNMEGGIRLRSV